MTICYWTRVWNETRGAVFKKQQFITSMLFNLCAYWNETRGTVFKKNPIDDNMLLNSCAKWNKRGSFQKTTIYYCMLFNLCAYWNETRGTVFKKKHKFITVCYLTHVHIEMKQERTVFKKKNTNWLQYAI